MSSELAAPTSQSRRLVFVDVLRGVACLWVTLCHAHAHWLDNYRSQPGDGVLLSSIMRFVGIGGKGVDLFIVISGFCLFYPFLERKLAGRPTTSMGDFYRRRAFRILPTYLAAVMFALVLLNVPGLPRIADFRGWQDVVPYLLLVQNYLPDYTARINGTLWSVAMEAQLYILFPILAWGLTRLGPAAVLGLALVTSVGAAVLAGRDVGAGGAVSLFSNIGMPQHLVQFALGMAAAIAVLSPRPSYKVWASVVSIVVLPLCLMTVTGSCPPALKVFGPTLWGLFFAAVVYLGSLAERRGWTALLPARWLAALGLISFSVYVVHFPVLLVTAPFAMTLFSHPLAGLGLFLVTGLPLIVAVGVLMFVCVERFSVPAVRLSKAATPAVRPPTAAITGIPPSAADRAESVLLSKGGNTP